MDVQALIEYVRQHEYLYNIHHEEYKNIQLKNATWEQIASLLNESIDACKFKWKVVRDGHMKHKKQAQAAKGSLKKANEYIWGSKLVFLDNFTTGRNRSVSQKRKKDNSQNVSPKYILPQSPPPSAQQEEEDHTNDTKYNLTHFDATDYLFLSYADTFKTLPRRRQCLLKVELAKLFAHAELANEANNELEDPLVFKTEVKPIYDGSDHNND